MDAPIDIPYVHPPSSLPEREKEKGAREMKGIIFRILHEINKSLCLVKTLLGHVYSLLCLLGFLKIK